MRNKPATLILISLSFITLSISGQKLINSPYSRFNIGSLEPAGSFRSIAMGGTGIAFRDNSSIYFTNPASYSSLDTNSFIFDFGVDYGFNILKDGDATYQSDDMNFDHLLMAFPVGKRIGIATGVIPASSGYYRLSDEVLKTDSDYDPVTGEYTSYHTGDGGFTNFFLGSGINITNNLSAGINMTLLFGNIRRTNEFVFSDFYYVFHNNISEKLRLSGVNFDYGLQYSAELKNDYFVNVGASLSPGRNYKSSWEKLSVRYNAYSSQDTLESSLDNSSKAFLPGTLRFGLAMGKKNKFVIGLDYLATNWSEAEIHGAVGTMADTRSMHLGAEFIPDKFSNYSYLRRIEYRIGGHVEDNYLILNGEQVKEFGLSLGVGLPLPRTPSKVNFFIDFTKKSGAGSTMLHDENFFTLGASLNFYDRWFIKRRYD